MSMILLRAACLAAVVAGVVAPALGQPKAKVKTGPYVQISLRQQLRQGLKCRRPIEFAFVDHVAELVEDGELPIDLVNICFQWSRQQNSFRPWVYFERSLRLLAKEKGFKI